MNGEVINDEFVVTDSLTGSPVVNFLMNDEYGLLLSDSLGGYSFNSAGQLLTRVSPDQATVDRPGRILYLRDHDTGESWPIVPTDTLGPTEHYQLRHGVGYLIVESEAHGIGLSAKVFVPPSDPLELWELKITNLTKMKRRLSLYLVMEWAEWLDSSTSTSNGLVATSRQYPDLAGFVSFDHQLDSFETDGQKFFGRTRGYLAPQALQDGRLSRTLGQLQTGSVAVIEKKLSLGSQAVFELGAMIGLVSGSRPQERARRLVSSYSDAAKRRTAFEAVAKNWQTLSNRHLIKSPDSAINERYNRWATYQGHLSNRYPSLNCYGHAKPFELQSVAEIVDQIILGLIDAPELAKKRLEDLFTRQFKDGGVADPLTATPEASLSFIKALTALSYENGDRSFLKSQFTYLDGGSGSGFEHLNRAFTYLLNNLSERHLLTKNHESVLLSAQLVSVLEEVIPLLEAEGEHHQVGLLTSQLEKLRRAIDKQWTGRGYARELTPHKVGESSQKFHQLDLLTQLWTIKGRVGDEKRLASCLTLVKKLLLTRKGVVDFIPPYPVARDDFPWSADYPGTGQNGAITIQNNLFLAQILALMGDGDTLVKFLSIAGFWIPTSISLIGDEQIRWGSPVALEWQKVVLESLAGVTATIGGLKIDPCLPRDWRHLEINRLFRGAEYHIRIYNPVRVCKGVERIIVDGNRVTGQVIPPFRTGSHMVEVYLG